MRRGKFGGSMRAPPSKVWVGSEELLHPPDRYHRGVKVPELSGAVLTRPRLSEEETHLPLENFTLWACSPLPSLLRPLGDDTAHCAAAAIDDDIYRGYGLSTFIKFQYLTPLLLRQ